MLMMNRFLMSANTRKLLLTGLGRVGSARGAETGADVARRTSGGLEWRLSETFWFAGGSRRRDPCRISNSLEPSDWLGYDFRTLGDDNLQFGLS